MNSSILFFWGGGPIQLLNNSMLFRIVFVPEEYLIEDEEEDLSTPECGDIGTKLGVKHDDTEESDDNHDHACLSDIQEHLEE